jgi:methionyl-tRNA formyltransferase
MRILFAGTPDFSVVALEALLQTGRVPVAVLSQPDRPSGRGRSLTASPVKQRAQTAGIPVHQPATLRTADAYDLITDFQADLMVVVAYGLILPQTILDLPVQGCWNIHASLLPRWRGAAPIQRAIEAGDDETGVCIMQMEAGLDTGPVLHRDRTPITATDTAGSLHDRLAVLGAKALTDALDRLERGTLPAAVAQAETGVCYANKLKKPEAQLDWSLSATILERKVRAYNPWPVAWVELGGERVRVWKAAVVEQGGAESARSIVAGTIVRADKGGIDIATAAGFLRLLEVQRPGKRRMPVADYLNARPLACG